MKTSIITAKVAHTRLKPKTHRLLYQVYYLAVDLDDLESGALDPVLPLNRFGLHSLYQKDHGYRDGRSWRQWVDDIADRFQLPDLRQVTLICMPRVLGYVFNPVSFWACRNGNDQLIAVICEVHNTFGETHSYVCFHKDFRPIQPRDRLRAEKCFHVSPFLKREGGYEFTFALLRQSCTIHIHYVNDAGQKVLVTSLGGTFSPLSRKTLRSAFYQNPLLTIRVIMRIHYHALRLYLKGIVYMCKPLARSQNITSANSLDRE